MPAEQASHAPQTVLRRGRPIWLAGDRSSTPIRYPALRGRYETEVAIVGGGLTGAMIAAIFAEAGVKVIVIEAERAGLGSTAASTALLLQEPDYDLTALARKYGPARAARIWRISHDITATFIDTIRRLEIACRLHPQDSTYYTLGPSGVPALRRELARRHAAGFAGTWLDTAAVRRATGIDCAAAIRTDGNARLNPVAACHGLLAASVRMGARVFERTVAGRIQPTSGGVRIQCGDGVIDARQVVIATGYATKYFRPLAGRFTMRRTYVLATERIGRRERRELGLGEQLLWDTARPYHYVRWTDDQRLLIGGEDRLVKPGATRTNQFITATRELREYFERILPGFANIRIASAWEGLFAMTPDGLPYIGAHRRYPGHAFALGYGGNGMTFAALSARILLEQWQGVQSDDHQLFAFSRTH